MLKEVTEYFLNQVYKKTQYSGSINTDKVISASSIGGEELRLYLKLKHGSKAKSEFTQSTIGTIYQEGINVVFEDDENVESEKRHTLDLGNNWILSGEIDQLIKLGHKRYAIVDNKLLKMDGRKLAFEDDRNSGYNLQLTTYSYLLRHSPETREEFHDAEIGLFLATVAKDTTQFVANPEETFIMKELTNIHDDENFLALVLDKCQRMDEMLDEERKPPEMCDKLFWWKEANTDNSRRPMACLHFCDQVDVCDFGSRFKKKYSLEDQMSVFDDL